MAKNSVGRRLVNAQKPPVLQHHPRTLGLVAWRDGAGLARPFNFHLRPDGDEIIQRQHGGGVGGSSRQTRGACTPVAESEAARLERPTKHRSSGDDVLHELGNRLNLLTLERGFAGVLRFFSACSKLRNKVPSGYAQSFGVFLNLRSFQTHAFTNDEKDTASDTGLVDVSDVAIASALDAFGGFTVDHHRACSDDFINFLR